VKAVDSSVVVAAFATWHEHHGIAREAMAGQSAAPDRPRGDRVLLGPDPPATAAPRQPVDRPCLPHRAVHRTISHPFRNRLPGATGHRSRRTDPRRSRLRRPDRVHRGRAPRHAPEPRSASHPDVRSRRRHGRAASSLSDSQCCCVGHGRREYEAVGKADDLQDGVSSPDSRQLRTFNLNAVMHKHTARPTVRSGHNRDC
jgi:hypothetical protein